ncbi:hypothetical protein JQS43_23385 [Natronosporangium hydrolyticum]|uniref:MFS transporter n=1 Tax=Natronosporangium hydrolyticum TaxID=2811111 RepID=A0A895YJW3_9ACTN|nr:hypothetical protein [Natronosporangium hydrolyticum]QSB14400.1 hypothetical protein JQS43_23385 [Natronosporangium hydrolyticum]
MPVGALLAGVLGELLGVRAALLVLGIGKCLAFLPVLLSPLRTTRALPTEPAPADPQLSEERTA